MRNYVLAVLALLVGGCVFFRLLETVAAEGPPGQGTKTLLGTATRWQYPNAKVSPGASMSDGEMVHQGERACSSVVLKVQFETSDEFDKVVKFYDELLKTPEKIEPDRLETATSVYTVDDVPSRQFKLKVFCVNQERTSTTIVVCSANGVPATHVTWSQFERGEMVRK